MCGQKSVAVPKKFGFDDAHTRPYVVVFCFVVLQSVACTRPRKIREFPRNLHFHPRALPSPLKGEKSRANRALSSSSSSSSQHLTNNSIPGTHAERRGGGGSHPSKKFSNLSRYAAFPPPLYETLEIGGGGRGKLAGLLLLRC